MTSKPKQPNPYVLPEEQRPREKLRRDPNGESLSDAEGRLVAVQVYEGDTGDPETVALTQ